VIENSTFSSNHSATGGGIAVLGVYFTNQPTPTKILLTLTNVTIYQNKADSGGALYVEELGNAPAQDFLIDVSLYNTIADGNRNADGTGNNNIETNDRTLNLASSYNLLGPNGRGGLTAANENILDDGNDPRLEALADNGGLTWTHKPSLPDFNGGNIIKGSIAIDHGGDAVAPSGNWDQRGNLYDRIVGIAVDIGAVELQKTSQDPNEPANERGVIGDMDWNGSVDFDDTSPFALGLSNHNGYENVYGVDPGIHGDVNQDGVFDFDDIAPFVELLQSQQSQSSGGSSALTKSALQELFGGTNSEPAVRFKKIVETFQYAASLDRQANEAELTEALNLIVELLSQWGSGV